MSTVHLETYSNDQSLYRNAKKLIKSCNIVPAARNRWALQELLSKWQGAQPFQPLPVNSHPDTAWYIV